MKYTRWMAVALLALTVGVACGQAPDNAQQQTMEAAPAAQQAADTMGTAPAVAQDSVIYVDVRTPEEYAAGHVEGAILIPYTEMEQRYTELEPYKDREIVLYCRSGRRAGIAMDVLEQHGFENLTNAGGLTDLQAEGVPTTQ